MDYAPRKFGKFSEETIRAAVTRDRESSAAATPYWHHSHGCVVDREGTIITWLEGQKNLYHGNAGRDPMKDLANARFTVGARGSVERRCDMIEALLAHIAQLETAMVNRKRAPVTKSQRLSDDEVQELIDAALAVSDKLGSDYDQASFSGSMNNAEDFKETVQRLWHRSCGWREETKTQTRKDIEAAQAWAREYETKHGPIEDPPLPDFMIVF